MSKKTKKNKKLSIVGRINVYDNRLELSPNIKKKEYFEPRYTTGVLNYDYEV